MADQRQQPAASCQGQWLGGGAGPSMGSEERLHLPHEWMGSRSKGWEERRGLPRGWQARDSEWGEEQDLTRMAGQTYSGAAGGAVQRQNKKELASRLQQGTVLQDSLNPIGQRFSSRWSAPILKSTVQQAVYQGMMEMKRNKTAEEPNKQNAGARKRVALEEEDRVNLDRWMTRPKHEVWTMFTKHPHVFYWPCHPSIHHFIHTPCHPFAISSIQHVIHSPWCSMPTIYNVIHSPCHSVTLSSIHYVIYSPCHPFTNSSIHHVIKSPCHQFIMLASHQVIHSPCCLLTMSSAHHVIYSPCHPFMSSSHQFAIPSSDLIIHSPCHQFTLTMLSIHHVIQSGSWSIPSIYHVIHSLSQPVTM